MGWGRGSTDALRCGKVGETLGGRGGLKKVWYAPWCTLCSHSVFLNLGLRVNMRKSTLET